MQVAHAQNPDSNISCPRSEGKQKMNCEALHFQLGSSAPAQRPSSELLLVKMCLSDLALSHRDFTRSEPTIQMTRVVSCSCEECQGFTLSPFRSGCNPRTVICSQLLPFDGTSTCLSYRLLIGNIILGNWHCVPLLRLVKVLHGALAFDLIGRHQFQDQVFATTNMSSNMSAGRVAGFVCRQK